MRRNKIFHWDEYLDDLHEVIEPKSLEEIAEAMQMTKPMKAKQFRAIVWMYSDLYSVLS